MKQTVTKCMLCSATLLLLLGAAAPPALAHRDETPAVVKPAEPISTEAHAFGKQGDPKMATRIIAVDMNDMMRFTPSEITVRQGETVRFVVRNKGKIMHEMVLGTMKELKAHGKLMQAYPGMEHDAPHMVHVRPQKQQSMVWQFTNPGEFFYACLIPGHFEAGMIGKINVVKG